MHSAHNMEQCYYEHIYCHASHMKAEYIELYSIEKMQITSIEYMWITNDYTAVDILIISCTFLLFEHWWLVLLYFTIKDNLCMPLSVLWSSRPLLLPRLHLVMSSIIYSYRRLLYDSHKRKDLLKTLRCENIFIFLISCIYLMKLCTLDHNRTMVKYVISHWVEYWIRILI